VFSFLAVVAEGANELELEGSLSRDDEITFPAIVGVVSGCGGTIEVRSNLLQMQYRAADGFFFG